MDIGGKRVLVLGGYGLVGSAVCRSLLRHAPRALIVSSLRREQSEAAIERLRSAHPESPTEFIPAWGDMLLRADWQDGGDGHPRDQVMHNPARRRQLVSDILAELDETILTESLLYRQITGAAPNLGGHAADVVIDCVNTATAVAYQNVFAAARKLEGRIESGAETDWPTEVERLLTSLYVPQLVRHMQILFESMVRAGTTAYIKVGTSGTGGMGFNIPYTHGEERPSRVLLSKSAVAGAQTMLLFLMARTPGGPPIVKEVKPTAAIAWKEIGYGEIRGGGRSIPLYDCPPSMAYPLEDNGVLAASGDFGERAKGELESVYIDTGENGLFAVGEFTALTHLGQMEFITPEEIAETVVAELVGSNTGHDVVAALDGAVLGPSYRAGVMRQAALKRMDQLEQAHDDHSIAFELLGPPRLSKLLFEAYLLKRAANTAAAVIASEPAELADSVFELIAGDADLRQRILSIGIPILAPDGDRLLRGPAVKSQSAEHGWIDLRPANLARWQSRLQTLQDTVQAALSDDSSSHIDRDLSPLRNWQAEEEINVGEVVGWLFSTEEDGRRMKA